MRWFANRKTATKLRLVLGSVLVIVIGISVVSYQMAAQLNAAMRESYEHGVIPITEAAELQKESYELRLAMLGFMRTLGDPGEMAKFDAAALQREQAINRIGERLAQRARTDEERGVLKQWKEHWDACVVAHRDVLRLGNAGDKERAWQALLGVGEYGSRYGAHFKVPLEMAAKVVDVKREQTLALATAGTRLSAQTVTLIVGGLLLALVLGCGLSFALPRAIARPLVQLAGVFRGIARDIAKGAGDLTVRLEARGQDEVGELIQSFNTFMDTLHEIIRQVRRAAEQAATASRQLSAASQQLSSGTQEQAASLEETAASLEQITSTVKQNADNARQANQLAVGSRDTAERGGLVVTTAVTAMGEISTASRKITDIIAAIDEIAFQTNLLALNAAVEAARAGEQGRGFAVVAAEVRNLAQRSATAAKEIKTLIKDSVGKVEAGSELVNQSGRTLGEIVSSVKRVTDIIAEIAAASEEQSRGVDQVNKTVAQMDQITQTGAAQAEELSSTAQSLATEAEQLLRLVAGFTLTDGRDDPSKPSVAMPTTASAMAAVPGESRRRRPSAAEPALVGVGHGSAGFEEF